MGKATDALLVPLHGGGAPVVPASSRWKMTRALNVFTMPSVTT